jgi:DNA-binding XRE family transcriptional regulator
LNCPGCDNRRASAKELRRYHYTESGLDNVWLNGGVLRFACPNCRQTYMQVMNEGQVQQLIAVDLLRKPFGLTGREMRYLRTVCDLTQEELATFLGVTRATVIEREGGRPIEPAAEYFFRAVMIEQLMLVVEATETGHLSREQIRALQKFRCEFTGLAVEPPRRRSSKVCVSHEPRGWRLAEAA